MDQNTADGRRAVLLIAASSSFLAPFMGAATNLALPAMEQALGLSAVLSNWVALSYLLAAAIGLVPCGRIADMVGRKRVFVLGVLVYTLASLLCAVAPGAAWLLLFRAWQGIGSAMIYGTVVAILTSVTPPGERGRALGIITAATYLGLSLGPSVGGLLTGAFGWPSIFWVNVPLGVVILLLVHWRLKGEWVEAQGKRFDWPGALVYGLALATLMIGFTRLSRTEGVGLTLIGVLGIIGFIWWEMRVQHPVLDLGLFRRNPVFGYSNLAALITYGATFAVTLLLSQYLQHVKALSPQQAGLLLVFQPAVMALLSPLSGWLSDRVDAQKPASVGMGVMVMGLALMVFLAAQTPLWFVAVCLLLLGCGFGLFSSPNTHAVMSSVTAESYGVASATLATMRLVGQTLSMGIATLVSALTLGAAQITPETHPQFLSGMRVTFVIFALLCFGGVFASLARGSTRLERWGS